jgi:hypothetical protein
MTTGVNRGMLLTVGWLDLIKGPQILHVPNMAGRYYSAQFTDPSNNTNFAYVGKRTTGTEAGDYLISGSGRKGAVLRGMARVSSPNDSVLVIGRAIVCERWRAPDFLRAYETDSGRPTHHSATQLLIVALSIRARSRSLRQRNEFYQRTRRRNLHSSSCTAPGLVQLRFRSMRGSTRPCPRRSVVSASISSRTAGRRSHAEH